LFSHHIKVDLELTNFLLCVSNKMHINKAEWITNDLVFFFLVGTHTYRKRLWIMVLKFNLFNYDYSWITFLAKLELIDKAKKKCLHHNNYDPIINQIKKKRFFILLQQINCYYSFEFCFCMTGCFCSLYYIPPKRWIFGDSYIMNGWIMQWFPDGGDNMIVEYELNELMVELKPKKRKPPQPEQCENKYFWDAGFSFLFI
jgi:hypothetical protein